MNIISPSGQPLFSRRRPSRYGCLILLFFPFLFSACVTFVFFGSVRHTRLSGTQTIGTVVDVTDCPDNSSDNTGDAILQSAHPLAGAATSSYNGKPTIQFTDTQGQPHQATSTACGRFTDGDKVTLWYLPNDPQTIATQTQIQTALVPLLLGVPFLLGLLWFLGRGVLFLAFAATNRSPQPLAYPSAPSATPASYLPMGEAATLEGRWGVTFRLATSSQGTERARPAPGYYYLLLGISVYNMLNVPQEMDEIVFRLWDSAGQEHQAVFIPAAVLPTGTLQPDEQARLVLPYEVPDANHVFTLILESSFSGATLAAWQFVVKPAHPQ